MNARLVCIELRRYEDVEHRRELFGVQRVAQADPGARPKRGKPVASRRRSWQRQEDRSVWGYQILFVQLAAQRVAIAIGELLVDDNRVRWITANASECLRAIVRSVKHVPMWRENTRERPARPFVRAGDEDIDWPCDRRS